MTFSPKSSDRFPFIHIGRLFRPAGSPFRRLKNAAPAFRIDSYLPRLRYLKGANVIRGQITFKGVADAFGMKLADIEKFL